jgi:hypothetical protein
MRPVCLASVAEGMRSLDEASTVAVDDQPRDVDARLTACCYLIYACERCPGLRQGYGVVRVRAPGGAGNGGNHARLAEVKRAYDPTHLLGSTRTSGRLVVRCCIRLDELRPDLGQLPTEFRRSDYFDAVAPPRQPLGELGGGGSADVDFKLATRSPISNLCIAAELNEQPFGRLRAGQGQGLNPGCGAHRPPLPPCATLRRDRSPVVGSPPGRSG